MESEDGSFATPVSGAPTECAHLLLTQVFVQNRRVEWTYMDGVVIAKKRWVMALIGAVAVTALAVPGHGWYLSGTSTDRCLRATAPVGTDETQAEVLTSADYVRGELICTWTNSSRAKTSTRVLPLYQRD